MMIEVKKEAEFNKAIKKSYEVDSNGEPKSQLMRYFNLDKQAEYIVYYTSYSSTEKKVKRQYQFIQTIEQQLHTCSNLKLVFQNWNKIYHKNGGIFEEDIQIYDNKVALITKGKLEPLSDSKAIFFQFLTILRKHSISDKANAFNKIFNLFICKIKDEDSKTNSAVVDFQWKHTDTYEALLNRLSDLYKSGVKEYLNIKIVDTEESKFNALIENITKDKKVEIKNIYNQLRLYKNNEFAFLEVFDQHTFEKNSQVIKAMIQLLEQFRLKYSNRDQFLGDFFEYLLNTGLKQENGQFFTPLPLARFIINSLPIERLVLGKINTLDSRAGKGNYREILPYSIDYAAGSGHFLTELMDELNNILNSIKKSPDFELFNDKVQNTINHYTDEKDLYNWASEYIYGIEKDYRLAKTAKVSCFLNGDGDANMIYADGLDSFTKSNPVYEGILSLDPKAIQTSKDNQVFDLVVANPPYSVEGFKDLLVHGKDSFELFDLLDEKSDDIECLFIERTKQLLKVKGLAGLILPTTVLANKGIFIHAREILLKHFKIKSVVDMSSRGKVFAKTGVNAIVMFLERMDEQVFKDIEELVKQFVNSKFNATISNIEKLPEKYVDEVYALSLQEYSDLLDGDIFTTKAPSIFTRNLSTQIDALLLKGPEIYLDYWDAWIDGFKNNKEEYDEKKLKTYLFSDFIKFVRSIEIEKMSFYALHFSEKCMVVSFPKDGNELKKFIGYEFSERSHNEGIKKRLTVTNKIDSSLFDEEIKHNPSKLNTHISKHISGDLLSIHSDLDKYINVQPINEILDYEQAIWSKVLKTKKRSHFIYENSKFPYQTMKSLFDIKTGSSKYKSIYIENNPGLIPLLTGELVCGHKKVKPINGVDIVKAGTISVNKDNAAGSRCNLRSYDFVMNSHHMALLPKATNNNDIEYVCFLFDYYLECNAFGWDDVLKDSVIKRLRIPVPSLQIQKQIVSDIKINMTSKTKVSVNDILSKYL